VTGSIVGQAEFSPDTASVRQARHFVVRSANAHDLDVENLELLVSELAANAVLHARTDFVVELSVSDSHVRVSVTDGSARPPVIKPDQPTAVTGRGMRLVDRLAARGGVDCLDDGKTVWFELPVVVA